MSHKVLIIDDDSHSLQTAESILKASGYETVALSDSKFVIKAIKTEKPDVIVSDILMPHKDGYTLCQEIRKLYGDKIPILLCTAKSYEREFIEMASKDFGANDFLIKPFVKEELLNKVAAIIASKPQDVAPSAKEA